MYTLYNRRLRIFDQFYDWCIGECNFMNEKFIKMTLLLRPHSENDGVVNSTHSCKIFCASNHQIKVGEKGTYFHFIYLLHTLTSNSSSTNLAPGLVFIYNESVLWTETSQCRALIVRMLVAFRLKCYFSAAVSN